MDHGTNNSFSSRTYRGTEIVVGSLVGIILVSRTYLWKEQEKIQNLKSQLCTQGTKSMYGEELEDPRLSSPILSLSNFIWIRKLQSTGITNRKI